MANPKAYDQSEQASSIILYLFSTAAPNSIALCAFNRAQNWACVYVCFSSFCLSPALLVDLPALLRLAYGGSRVGGAEGIAQ